MKWNSRVDGAAGTFVQDWQRLRRNLQELVAGIGRGSRQKGINACRSARCIFHTRGQSGIFCLYSDARVRWHVTDRFFEREVTSIFRGKCKWLSATNLGWDEVGPDFCLISLWHDSTGFEFSMESEALHASGGCSRVDALLAWPKF